MPIKGLNTYSAIILAGGTLDHKIIGPSPPLNKHPVALVDGSGYALTQTTKRLRQVPEISSIYVVIDTPKEIVPPMASADHWEWIIVEPQDSVIGTLSEALQKIKNQNLIIIPITTLPPLCIPPGEWIGFSQQKLIRENWSSILQPLSSKPVFLDKLSPHVKDEAPSHAFTGIIKAKKDSLNLAISSFKKPEVENYDLLHVAIELWKKKKARIELFDWLDLGHIATYSKRRLSKLESRSFNSIQYDRGRDVIKKTSSNIKTLQGEIKYINSLQETCKRYFPRILATSTSVDDKCWVEYEYIPFANMAELFLHWDIGPNAWSTLIDRLAVITKSIKHEDVPKFATKTGDMAWLYHEKMQTRLNNLAKDPPRLDITSVHSDWKYWWENPYKVAIIVDSTKSEKACEIKLDSALHDSELLLSELNPFEKDIILRKIHGDLCFNNILADPITGVVRLIDPRGETPDSTWPIGFGDARYDMIKLLHSSKYLYDLIVNDMFTIKFLKNTVYFSVKIPGYYNFVNKEIEDKIIGKSLTDDEERILTSSLFFSMLYLHRENPLRCMALTCIGQLIYTGNFSNALESFRSIS